MLIADAQVHIWAADTPERPWPKRHKPHREPALGKDELLKEMDAAGVDRVVLVPPSWEGERNDVCLAATRAHPQRFAVMGRLDPEAPGAREALASWKKQSGALGLRFTFHRPGLVEVLTEGRADWVWREAEAHGVPLMILVPHKMMPLIDAIAARHPGLRIVMDHLGMPSSSADGDPFASLDKLIALAKRPNVAAKASALPCLARDEYPYRSVHEHLKRVCEAFGPQRVFWGTDLSRLPCTYRQAVTMFTEEIPWLAAEDKEWIMGRGLCEWLGWKLP